jgi:hypothetical protein
VKHSKILLAIMGAAVLPAAMIITSCSQSPTSSDQPLSAADLSSAGMSMSPMAVGGPPGYEEAYVGGETVTINAIEVPQNPTGKAQADFYEVVYPFDPATGQELTNLWPSPPQCNPCDHQGNGITPDDFHDHVLDSRPSDPGHGEYNALWAVYLIMPNYTADANHNAAVNDTLASLLPVKSEAAVDSLLATQVDGMPIANEINTNFYFICAVVGNAAGSHTH